jgi:SHAQKYF class myb-like DNA-binding protein
MAKISKKSLSGGKRIKAIVTITTSALAWEESVDPMKEIPHVILNSDHDSVEDSLSTVSAECQPLDQPPGMDAKWSEDDHRALVEGIYDIGIRNASPSLILGNMLNVSGLVTKEKLKSHLQKYRVSKDKSKEEFMAVYDNWMKGTQELVQQKQGKIKSSEALANLFDTRSLGSGDLAAFLSLSSMLDDAEEEDLDVDVNEYSNKASELLDLVGPLTFPKLTEEESASPLGQMLMNVKGCFSVLETILQEQRNKKEGGDCHSGLEPGDINPISLSPESCKRPLSPGLDDIIGIPLILTSPCMTPESNPAETLPYIPPMAPLPPNWRPPIRPGLPFRYHQPPTARDTRSLPENVPIKRMRIGPGPPSSGPHDGPPRKPGPPGYYPPPHNYAYPYPGLPQRRFLPPLSHEPTPVPSPFWIPHASLQGISFVSGPGTAAHSK